MRYEQWGWHLTIDASNCEIDKVKDPEYLKEWVKDLVKVIDMVPHGEPQISHFGHGAKHLGGWTVLQFIETSNILCHFCDLHGDAYLDVFSCKEFDKDVVIQHFEDWFWPNGIDTNFVNRGAWREEYE